MSDSKLGAQARGQRNLVPEVLDKAPAGTELGWVVWVANPSSGGGGTVDQGKKGSSGESWYVQDGSGLLATAAKQDTANASLAAIDSKLGGPLAVTGPLTNAELRAAAVPVSAAALPLPAGAATELTVVSILGQLDNKTSTLATQVTAAAILAQLDAKTSTLATASAQTTSNTSLATIATQQTDGTQKTQISGSVAVTGPLTDAQLRATPVPVSGTVTVTSTTANQGTGAGAASPWSVQLSDGTSSYTGAKTGQLPSTLGQATKAGSLSVTIASDNTVAVSASSLPLPTGAATETTLALLTVAQNSTTGGQSGPLMMGAVTTNAPTYLNNRTQPFSLDTSGGMRVAGYNTPATAQANPTNAVPTQAFLMVWNGTTWDRLLSEGISADADNAPSAGTVSAESYNMAFNGTTWDRVRSSGDNGTNPSLGKQAVLIGTVATSAPSWTNGNIAPLSITTAGDARAIAKITDGTNTAAVKAASTAVVASDPAVAVSLSPNSALPTGDNTIGRTKITDGTSVAAIASGTASAVNAQVVTPNQQQTFVVSAQGIAPGNGKSMISLANGSGSGKTIRIQAISFYPVTDSAVAGVNVQFDGFKFTTHASGTSLTPIALDSSNSLSGSVTAQTNATITGSGTIALDSWFQNSDEITSAGLTPSAQASIDGQRRRVYGGCEMQPIVVRAGEGFHIKCQTNTTVGAFSVFIWFTQE